MALADMMKDQRLTNIKPFGNNDPGWYRHYETLSNDVASIFMSRPNGTPYPQHNVIIGAGSGSIDAEIVQGGFLDINMLPTFGGTHFDGSAADSINTAASKLYYYIVHGNSRNISYDKSDLMRCLMGYDSLQMVIAEAIRAYKFIKSINPKNKWYKHILTCLGWDADDLYANIVQFRTQINFAIQRFNQISIPDVFDIFHAHKSMYDYVYADRPGDKAQFAACTLHGFWFYNDEKATVDWVRQITWNQVLYVYDSDIRLRKVSDFVGVSNFLLHTLYDSTDMGVMQGDIKRAFGESQLLTMYMIQEDNDLPILYDDREFGLKLHNLEMGLSLSQTGTTYSLVTDDLSYSPSATYRDDDLASGNLVLLMCDPIQMAGTGKTQSLLVDGVHMMDLPDDQNQDVDSVIQMQLFKSLDYDMVSTKFYSDDLTSGNFVSGLVGPYMVMELNWFCDPDSGLLTRMANYTRYTKYDLNNANNWKDFVNLASFAQYATTLPIPIWVTSVGNLGSGVYRKLPLQWEVENVTVYSGAVLENILRTVIESLYFSPLLYNGSH